MSAQDPTNAQQLKSPDYHSLSLAYQTYLKHDQEEQNHWDDVCRSFRQYATFATSQWTNQQSRFHALPESQRNLLPAALRRDTPEFLGRAALYKEAAVRNQFCLDCILRHAGMPHSQQAPNLNVAATDAQMSKVSSVLKSLVRDWSTEGKPERDLAYQPILAQMKKYVPISISRRAARVCVPGAGVGRLSLELSALGYSVQGNDFSLYMLLASDFILNGGIATPEHPLKISPWLLESRNVHSPLDPLREVQIPDVDPFAMLSRRPRAAGDESGPDFSMAAGEFASIYNQPKEHNQWDAVVCCFFLDAGPCILEYIQIIYNMLKPNGILINFGPLLYHWSGPAMRPDDGSVEEYQARYAYLDRRYLTSVDLCWEDIREILINVGFEIVEEKTGRKALYTADLRSMMNLSYRCANFVARKRCQPPQGTNGGVATKWVSFG